MRAQGGRYEPGLAPAQPVSQHVTGVGLGIAHGHQGCGSFPLREDHPIPGGRYAVITWWLCIVVYACLGGLACIVVYACLGGLACIVVYACLGGLACIVVYACLGGL